MPQITKAPRRIHWLLGDDKMLSKDILASDVASIRLRAGCLASLKQPARCKISFGSSVIAPDALIIGKPRGASQFPQWLACAEASKRRGARIIVDYTDHHLNSGSPQGEFYLALTTLADLFVVPSDHMRHLLSPFYTREILVVEDALEHDIVPPGAMAAQPFTALWFGHESNIDFLVEFLRDEDSNLQSCNLNVVTSHDGMTRLRSMGLRPGRVRQLNFIKWSVDALRRAASASDFCIIPSDLRSRQKAGVSSNRLVTALALGLPTAADMLPSYREFSAYFIDIRGPDYPAMTADPVRFQSRVVDWQSRAGDRFSMAALGTKWLAAALNSSDTP